MQSKIEVQQENIKDLKDENIRLKEELDYEMFSAREAFRIVVESNLDAIIGIDNNCNIILLNPAGEELFQYVEKELLNKPIEILFKDEFEEEYHTKLLKFLKDGIFERDFLNKTTEVFFKKRDGTYFEGETSFAVGRGKSNLYIVLTIRDISLRKRIERELVESEAKARTLLNTPHQSVVLIDQNGKIIDCNQSCLQLWNSKQNEVIGRNIAAFVNSESSNDILIKIKWVFSSSEILRYETNTKNEYFDNVIYPVVDKSGNVVQAVLVIYDITDFKLEHKLCLPENKISFSQPILSELNHDIRTPLSGIIGICNMLSHSNLNKEEKEYISIIKDSSESVISLFQNFIDLFLLEKQNIQLTIKPFRVRNKLNEYITSQNNIANPDNIAIKISFLDEFPEIIHTDEYRYMQVLDCLLKQTIRNTNKGNISINLSINEFKGNKIIKTKIESDNFILKDETKIVLNHISQDKNLSVSALNNFLEIEFYLAKMIIALMGGELSINKDRAEFFAIEFTIKI